MKAEHRKELQTNSLADHLGQAVTSLKTGHTSTLVLLALVALIGGWYAWSYFSQSNRASDAMLWTDLDLAIDQEQLAAFAEANPGTTQARTANFEIARYMIQQGSEKFGNPDKHGEAIKELIKARQLYKDLVPLCRSEPILQQEALMGLAKAEESLIAAPNPDDPKQSAGSIDQAIAYYQDLASKYPESFQGKAARKRGEELKKDKKPIEEFYASMNRQAAKK